VLGQECTQRNIFGALVVVKLHLINPIAKALLGNRRKPQVVPPKKGKGSYNRKKEKEKFNAKARSNNISED
jgi:hypothetical protein